MPVAIVNDPRQLREHMQQTIADDHAAIASGDAELAELCEQRFPSEDAPSLLELSTLLGEIAPHIAAAESGLAIDIGRITAAHERLCAAAEVVLAERGRAYQGLETPDCRVSGCQDCGVCDQDRLSLRLHYWICDACARYRNQLMMVRHALRRSSGLPSQDTSSSPSQIDKARLTDAFRAKHPSQ